MNEYHIINKLQEMTMVSNAYKIKNASGKVVTNLLIARFTGQLKRWWENVLTIQQQTDILESIQINEIGEQILNLDNEPIKRIQTLKDKIITNLCSGLSDAFWHRKRHMVSLPYEKDFSEQNIPTRARPI
ncbi:hypothetical protein CFOL_v3_10215 [Cephalotus follicularis]|uniref:DUF7746 domain-containing protein n=1 Tax=Cephalotus follicularis TaxID=3775 RepID=A0A1Q3BFK6_CEPFO|nr:hypothetical protein CFOL_v3_10215 [Cephalotus follicularis]